MHRFRQCIVIVLSLIVCLGVAYGSYVSNKNHVYTATTLAILEPKGRDGLAMQTKAQQKVAALHDYAYSTAQMNYLYKRIQNVSNITDNYDSLKSSYGIANDNGATVFSVWSNDKVKSAAIRKSAIGYMGIQKYLDKDNQYNVRIVRKSQVTGSFMTFDGHKLRNYLFSGVLVGILIGVLLVIIFDGDKNDKG